MSAAVRPTLALKTAKFRHLEEVAVRRVYSRRAENNSLFQRMRFEQREAATEHVKKKSENADETQAERRERQAQEIAAIVRDVAFRESWKEFDIAYMNRTGASESIDEVNRRTQTLMEHQAGVGRALIKALGRLLGAESDTTTRALEILQNSVNSIWGVGPDTSDPIIGVLHNPASVDDSLDEERA